MKSPERKYILWWIVMVIVLIVVMCLIWMYYDGMIEALEEKMK